MCRYKQASVDHIRSILKYFPSVVEGEEYEIVMRAVD